jgi:hypothetical protein
MAVETAGVGHQDPKQAGVAARAGAQIPNVEGTQCADIPGVTQARRQRRAIVIIDSERHEQVQPGFEFGGGHGTAPEMADLQYPNKTRKSRC